MKTDRRKPLGDKTAGIIAVSVSEAKGRPKDNVAEAFLKEGFGLMGDAHAGGGLRQVSLLAVESIHKMRAKGLDVGPGDFAENITTEGVDLVRLPLGTRLKAGKEVLFEITQIGKTCHARCRIYYQAGDCVMPKEGVFAKVVKGGTIRPGDQIAVVTAKEIKNV